jgi:hypothetical protein
MEALRGACFEATLVQDSGNLRFGMMIEQLIDRGDHGRIRLPKFPCAQRRRHIQCGGRSAAEAHLRQDRPAFGQRDVLDEESHHSFAFPVRRRRFIPELRQV